MKRIIFYFDYLSPFSYFAWKRIRSLQKALQLEIEYKPVLLGVLLSHWGQKGPAEIEPKREYAFKQCLRYATKEGIAFTMPKYHPFNPLPSLRVSVKSASNELQTSVMNTLWNAGWAQGLDLGNPDELERVLNEAGLPGNKLMELCQTGEVKAELKTLTQEAIEKGVFGVPTFVVDDELFWGLDSIEGMINYINGEDNIDRAHLIKMLDTQATATRK